MKTTIFALVALVAAGAQATAQPASTPAAPPRAAAPAAPASSATAQRPAVAPPAASTEAPKPAAAEPQRPATNDQGAESTTATFGDWELRCWRPGAGTPQASARTCEVIQSAVIQGQAAPVAQLAFGRADASDQIFFTALVPNNVALATPLKVVLGEGGAEPLNVPWTRCLPRGCFATTAATESVLNQWRPRTDSGRVVYTAGAGGEIAIPMSFRGLGRALEAFAREK